MFGAGRPYLILDEKSFESEEEIKNFLRFSGRKNPEAIHTGHFKYPARNPKIPPHQLDYLVEQAIKEYGNKVVLLFSPEEINSYPYPQSVKLLFPDEWRIAESIARIKYKLDENSAKSLKLVAIMHPYNYLIREFIVDFFEIDAAQVYLNEFLYRLKESKKEGKYYVIARKKLIATV